ncbi:uncharacterized protein J3R85_004391, partial [Psidium guajava]
SLWFLVLNFIKMDSLPSSFLRDIKHQLITKAVPMSTERLPPVPPLPPRSLSSAHITTISSVTTRGKPKYSKSHILSPTSSKKGESLSLPALMFKALDDIIIDFLDPPIKPSLDPRTVLSGNFAPVDELPPTECEVSEGSLPQCLDGAYIRNGPNPQFIPRGAYHLFDGDGMLHSIRISQGRATFCSRYVKTNKYTVERSLGSPVFPNIFSGFSDGDIETLGRHDFDGMLSMSMTAHPKVDPETGEAYAYKYNPFFPPFLTFFKFDRSGMKHPDMPVLSLSRPPFIHDFAITRKYAVFPDTQMGVNPMGVVLGGSLRLDLVHGLMEKITINLKDGRVSRRRISAMNLDLPVINPAYIGKFSRYVYAGVADPMPKMSGVVKLDLVKHEGTGGCVVASRNYGLGCYGGEPFFVARDPEHPEAKEDDGYIVSYVHNEKVNESRFLVMDAKSPDLDVVAAVRLPQRVPYGFHGIFVRESDLSML